MCNRTARFLSAFIAAWMSLKLLQTKKSESFVEKISIESSSTKELTIQEVHYAGRTIDLTLFAFSRAADTIIGQLWTRRKARKVQANSWRWYDRLISYQADASMFAVSCALIMWAWVYVPERLPKAYNRWITTAAAIDSRLPDLLRRARWGEFLYGQENGPDPAIESMCRDYGWPIAWADSARTIPIPCQMVR